MGPVQQLRRQRKEGKLMADEPTRTCGSCGGSGNVTEMVQVGTNEAGKPIFENRTRPCGACGGSGVR